MVVRNARVVAIEWTHQGNQDVDEVVVRAPTAADACFQARKRWREAVGSNWPGIRIRRVFVIDQRMRGG